MPRKKIIVTGAAGFVGGQTMLHFRDQGHKVIGVDSMPILDHMRGVPDVFLHEDFAGSYILETIRRENPHAIVHCAGSSLVGPSVKTPNVYYENNFVKTKKLADFLVTNRISSRLIFASSSSIYGEAISIPINEDSVPAPVSPYGESKRMTEMMLASYHLAYGLDFVALRYFNVCGADPQARHGQRPGATHIIARILESLRDNRTFALMGTDYDTPDGTCVRDHVHVQDLARAHELAMERDFAPGFYNVGLEHGASNQEIIDMAQKITGRILDVKRADRRAGDPAQLVGSNHKLLAQGWTPAYGLEDMIRHAWAWHTR